jgi:hypothetical protein
MSLTNAAESRVANWLTGNSTTAPTLPLKVRLMTVNGSDSAAGTELTGGTYAPQTVTYGASAGGAAGANDAIVRFEGIANPSVIAGFEIWDSAGTPFRWHWAALTGGDKTVTDGVLEFAVGALTIPVD